MRSLDKLITIGRLILLYESLIAGLVFITVAITVILNPAMAAGALKLGYISEIKRFLDPSVPMGSIALFVVSVSFLLGAVNLSVAWAAGYEKIERRKPWMKR